ncbi:MAG TPA: NUDIX hydrolase [Nitrosarchaeum sp.]|nr:NUDIX hydrolase [Nitrosarchaeum sp.]
MIAVEFYVNNFTRVMRSTANCILRASVVPYTVMNGQLLFVFGKDTKSGDITDFGGGVKKHETISDACLRELEEEAQFKGKINSFDIFFVNEQKNCFILFMPLSSYDFFVMVNNFDKCEKSAKQEISSVMVFNEKELQDCVAVMWSKIKGVYKHLLFNTNIKRILKQRFAYKNMSV